MFKLLALYKTPADPAHFLAHYKTTHMPLVQKIPGLAKAEITKLSPAVVGEQGNFLIAEMYFNDEASCKAAMRSAEFAACGKDLANFAEGLCTVMKGEVLNL
jgi:uncharacterized protein (TIGR02118 family)